jgi:hypothetical protein
MDLRITNIKTFRYFYNNKLINQNIKHANEIYSDVAHKAIKHDIKTKILFFKNLYVFMYNYNWLSFATDKWGGN